MNIMGFFMAGFLLAFILCMILAVVSAKSRNFIYAGLGCGLCAAYCIMVMMNGGNYHKAVYQTLIAVVLFASAIKLQLLLDKKVRRRRKI